MEILIIDFSGFIFGKTDLSKIIFFLILLIAPIFSNSKTFLLAVSFGNKSLLDKSIILNLLIST